MLMSISTHVLIMNFQGTCLVDALRESPIMGLSFFQVILYLTNVYIGLEKALGIVLLNDSPATGD